MGRKGCRRGRLREGQATGYVSCATSPTHLQIFVMGSARCSTVCNCHPRTCTAAANHTERGATLQCMLLRRAVVAGSVQAIFVATDASDTAFVGTEGPCRGVAMLTARSTLTGVGAEKRMTERGGGERDRMDAGMEGGRDVRSKGGRGNQRANALDEWNAKRESPFHAVFKRHNIPPPPPFRRRERY